MTLLRPQALKPGDQVAVVCLSSPVDKAAQLEAGMQAMEQVGLKPEAFPSALAAGTMYDYLAGDDEQRVADLTRALTDPKYAAVFLAKGGYGVQRALQKMDWSLVDPTRPKAVVGYSDGTALLEALAVKLGWVSLFGPMVACQGFREGVDEYDFKELMRLLFTPADVSGLTFKNHRTLVPGTAEGMTLGGTATLLATNLGTDTSYPAQDAILFLEDVDERPFRLDRIITQIRRSTYLKGVAGIILGSFTECGDPKAVEALLAERLGDLGVPILAGADIGHNTAMQTYPIGVQARLDADRGTLAFLDPVLLDTRESE